MKKIFNMNKFKLLLQLSFLISASAFSQDKFQLSSHILNVAQGKPAANVKIKLSKLENDQWKQVDEKLTDENGRIKDFLRQDGKDHRGVYKLTYFTKPYFEKQNQSSFYPFIEVVFELKDNEHYHVPITLSAYGYSTYRGN